MSLETMITYRPANPAEFVTEWAWQTTLDWAHDAAEWEPVEVIEERWELVERKRYTVREPCGEDQGRVGVRPHEPDSSRDRSHHGQGVSGADGCHRQGRRCSPEIRPRLLL